MRIALTNTQASANSRPMILPTQAKNKPELKGCFGPDMIIWLVVSTILKIWKSVGMIIPNIWKNIKCSKPPTSYGILKSTDKARMESLAAQLPSTYSVLLSLQLRLFSVCVLACILLLLSSAFYALSSLSCFSPCIFLIFLIFLLHIHVQIFLCGLSFQPGKKGFESYHHPQWMLENSPDPPGKSNPPHELWEKTW